MFDITNIAKKIKQARIDKNMTQMNLADAMGVSYQAVSNWERGNSMPDISKLGDLCAALDISVNELLGIDAPVVTKAMEKEALTMEELAEVAPMLPPRTLRERMGEMEQHLQGKLQNMTEHLMDVFEDVEAAVKDWTDSNVDFTVEVKKKAEESGQKKTGKKKKLDLSRIADLAPFLGQEYLDELIADGEIEDLDGLEDIAPYLSRESLHILVDRADPEDYDEIVEIAPYLSRETIDKFVGRCADAMDFEAVAELAPFVRKETLDLLVDRLICENCSEDLSELYPFLSKGALQKLARYLVENRDLDGLEELTSYI